jgi:centromeric protein E
MAATIPRPSLPVSRPSYGPPTSALPALPVPKSRKSTGAIPTIADPKFASPLPKSGLRAPSSVHTTPVTPAPTTALPKLRTTPGSVGGPKTIRKQISINAFPQPPRGVRTSSLPPSPLSGGITSSNEKKDFAESNLGNPTTPKLRKMIKSSISPAQHTAYVGSSTPSLLNGSGDSKSISSGPGARGSDGLLSLPSPPQSRSSSAQDSYSTSATNYDDIEGARGRQSSAELANDGGAAPPEGKGNVIVSVRVRPDAGGENHSKTDGEWMVDGRRSLVAYKGREGGDYYYGESLYQVIEIPV